MALAKSKTLSVRDNRRTRRGSGVAKNIMELIRAKLVMSAYASSVNPLPRVYNPGTFTNTETNRTIHHANVTRVRKIPAIN